jgi:hypothetical protein
MPGHKPLYFFVLDTRHEYLSINNINLYPGMFFDFKDDEYSNNVKLSVSPTHLLRLKIRNTTKYLNWRL